MWPAFLDSHFWTHYRGGVSARYGKPRPMRKVLNSAKGILVSILFRLVLFGIAWFLYVTIIILIENNVKRKPQLLNLSKIDESLYSMSLVLFAD
jgi:hypothetical protein